MAFEFVQDAAAGGLDFGALTKSIEPLVGAVTSLLGRAGELGGMLSGLLNGTGKVGTALNGSLGDEGFLGNLATGSGAINNIGGKLAEVPAGLLEKLTDIVGSFAPKGTTEVVVNGVDGAANTKSGLSASLPFGS